MALPIKELPAKIKKLLTFYKKQFTRPQYKNFRDLVIGLIVSDKKNTQEIADCFGRVDQSNLNRFLTSSDWDEEKINNQRIRQIKKKCDLQKGILICDPTMLHKSGKHMEKANYHYSGMTKKEEWGHCFVAYTQIILMKNDAILRPLKRALQTIGEGCRYVRLLALKGTSWLKQKAKNVGELTKILNKLVFVKNTKV